MVNNLTEDGKIRTIRYLKATHEDFSKLVNEGKKVKEEIEEMEKSFQMAMEEVKEKIKSDPNEQVFINGENKSLFEVYTYLVKKHAELDAYRNTYHFLMEEGVDELLVSIEIDPESYDYDFYELCLEN